MSYCEIKLKTNDFTFITCSCYYHDWKKIKDNEDESWKFDEIEQGKKSLRKLFYQKKFVLHCCCSCFDKAIIMNPFVIEDENAIAGYCIVKKILNAASIEDICSACIFFFFK